MIGLLNYFKGELRIKVWGFSPERFMNLCSNKQIVLWNIEREGEVYFMNISLSDFYQLKGIAKKTGTRVLILKRRGFPFLVPKLWKRKIFLLGFSLAVFFWIFSAAFVWDIQLDGNVQITEDIFSRFLKNEKVYVGMGKRNLDIKSLEKEIRKSFPQVTWTSAKLSGTKLMISIRENDILEKEKTEEQRGADLVSPYEGVIVSMIVRSGEPKVKIGDTVSPGTVLVAGSVPIRTDDGSVREYHAVEADGDIELEHRITFQDSLPMEYQKKEYTGREKKKKFLLVFGKQLNFPSFSEPFLVSDSVTKQYRPLVFEKLSIPIFWGTTIQREYYPVQHLYGKEEAKDLLKEKLNAFLESLSEKGVQIIEKNVKIETRVGVWLVYGDLLIREKVLERVVTDPAGIQP